MNGRNWNTLRRYTCGSGSWVSGLLHPTDRHLVRRSSFVCCKDLAQVRLAMEGATSVFPRPIPLTKIQFHAYARAQSPHSFAAASFAGSISTLRRNVWNVKTSKLLGGSPALEFMCITTTAIKERFPQPLYRKRRKKGKGRGAQASRLLAGELAQDAKSSKKGEKSVVVVESPAKARTIEKYLGERHVVLPSFGHMRDLAAKSGSVRPDEDFELVWEVPSSARQHLNSIKAALKGARNLVLASDPDREGEAIAWHVLEMLKLEGAVKSSLKVRRVVFNEITKAAVLQAMDTPRDISMTLVDAYRARRALDYLIGFDLSPVLWRKLPGSKSAGRVQSAALRLVCEREVEMETFVSREYWTINAHVSPSDNDKKSSTSDANFHPQATFLAKVTHVDSEKLSQFSLSSEVQAQAVAQRVEMSRFSVCSVKKSVVRRNPPAPYITSTLQQDASNKLAFGASRTMALAQQLYEGVKLDNDELTGLITYMRTDGAQLSGEAVHNIRSLITTRYGDQYTPRQQRQFASKVKNAQEAHEAIRPTDIYRLPSILVNILDEDALRLYSLIWSRTVACQMEVAVFAQVAVDIMNDTEDVQLRASGSSMSFPGFLTVFKDKVALTLCTDDDTGSDEGGDFQSEGENLGSLEAGDPLSLKKVHPDQHFTEAPPRYSEGSLVKRLEDLGIGRPSTYASTLKTLQSRNYVRIEKRRVFPENRGRMVSAFLLHYFPKLSDYEFTAKLETQLDEVSAGHTQWKKVLADFWPEFHEGVTTVLKIPFDEVVHLLEHVFAKQFFSGSSERVCPSCLEGEIGLKLSRFGSGYFLGCSRYPKCMYKTSVLSAEGGDSSDEEETSPSLDSKTRLIGIDPASGLQIALKHGPYGKYLQLGSGSKKQRPKRAAIPKDMDADMIDLTEALEILKYPLELGRHPETNFPMTIAVGQYGHYLRCKGTFVSIPEETAGSLTVEQGVALLQSKHVSKRGRKKDESESKNEPVASKAPATKVKAPTISSMKKLTAAVTSTAKKGGKKPSP